MHPRTLLFALALLAFAGVDAAAVAWPSVHGGWLPDKAWPVALVVCQISLAAGAIVWGPGPLAVRIAFFAAAVGFGSVVSERILLAPWVRPLGSWLLLGAVAAGLCGLLRLGGLRLMDAAEPLPTHPPGKEPPANKPAGLGPRQYSLGSLVTVMLAVALAAGIARYVQPPSVIEVLAIALLCSGWAVASVASLLVVNLEGPLWPRTVLVLLLIVFVTLVGTTLDGIAAVAQAAPRAFLEVCVPVMALMGLAGGLVRILGFELCWDD